MNHKYLSMKGTDCIYGREEISWKRAHLGGDARLPDYRGRRVVDLSDHNELASCPKLARTPKHHATSYPIHAQPSYFKFTMSGAGYDVVVDVDEEVSLRSLKYVGVSS